MSVRTTPLRWQLALRMDDADRAHYGDMPPLIAALLQGRGVPPADAATFLSDRAASLPDPMLMSGMADAVARIRRAHESGETVCIYGDYDADGLTAQAVLVIAFRAWGFADVRHYTPHREREGYGLHDRALAALVAQGSSLVIAVDLGISNAREIARIHEHGLDVIVVDHHHIPADIPLAAAVVNPHLPDNRYPYPHLAGVGVAYALVRALAQSGAPFARPDDALLKTLLAFVAIGTVADIVPLTGENRTLVQAGLRAIQKTDHAGLRALWERAGIAIGTTDASHIAFAIAPRLNAPGRVRGVEDAHRLLLPTSEREARLAALALDEANQTRQAETRRAVSEAIALIDSSALAETQRVLVVGDATWSIGIVGLVAARLVERYHRPALVYAQGASTSRGSARSIAGFDIIDALRANAALMLHYGGHPRAAGFTIENANIDALHRALMHCADALTGEELAPVLHLDAQVAHAEVSLRTHDEIAKLAPFGHANAEPVLLVPGVRVREARCVGGDGSHLSFQAVLSTGATVRCIAFGLGSREAELTGAGRLDLAAILQRDVWQGDVRLQLRVRDFRQASD